ncbi:MAG: hypothetical protein ABSE73_08420 [Planctomycetota bacterium]
MTTITARCGKKLPIPNRPFSNLEFGCEVTVELEQAATPQMIDQKVLELFTQLAVCVDAQFSVSNGKSNSKDDEAIQFDLGDDSPPANLPAPRPATAPSPAMPPPGRPSYREQFP